MGLQDTGPWHPRWNSEIYNLYRELNIVDCIKMIRLGWVCHIVRMEDERIPKKFIMGNYTRPVGKPRTR